MSETGPYVLTVKEVAQLLRIHRPKVYELIRENALDGFKLGADWRIKRESVERLIGEIPDEFFTDSGSFTLKNLGKRKSGAEEGGT